jgi:hypothetical protein
LGNNYVKEIQLGLRVLIEGYSVVGERTVHAKGSPSLSGEPRKGWWLGKPMNAGGRKMKRKEFSLLAPMFRDQRHHVGVPLQSKNCRKGIGVPFGNPGLISKKIPGS